LVGASSSFSSILTSVSSSQQQISSSLLNVIAVYATTGSNSFRSTQSITGSLTVTGQIIAQSLNVQQVTSSIIYSSGSNVFGCDINSRQTFTGSFYQTGSVASFSNCVTVAGALSGTSATFNANSNAITLNALTGTTNTQLKVGNTSGDNYFGVAASDGSSVFTGTTAYSAYLGTNVARSLHLATNGIIRQTIDLNGAATFSSSVALGTFLSINNGTAATSYIEFNYNPIDPRAKSWRLWNDQDQYGDFAISQATSQGGSTYAPKFLITTLGNVGIGTSTPTSSLDVSGSVYIRSSSGGVLYIPRVTDPSHGLSIGEQNTIGSKSAVIRTGGGVSEYLFIDPGLNDSNVAGNIALASATTGSVGIGTYLPKTKLQVVGLTGAASGGATSIPSLGFANCSSIALFTNKDTDYGTLFGTLNTGNGWIQQQRVDGTGTAYSLLLQPNGGNVGIGNTSPGSKLSVAGVVALGNSIDGATNLSYGGRISAKLTTVPGSSSTIIHRGLGSVGYFILVSGVGPVGSNVGRFMDLVYGTGASAAPVTLASNQGGTSAPTRTYSLSSEKLYVTLSGGDSWAVTTTGLGAMEE
jgi:hypothetical protein